MSIWNDKLLRGVGKHKETYSPIAGVGEVPVKGTRVLRVAMVVGRKSHQEIRERGGEWVFGSDERVSECHLSPALTS